MSVIGNGNKGPLESAKALQDWVESHLGEKYGVVPMHRIRGNVTASQLPGEPVDGEVMTADSAEKGGIKFAPPDVTSAELAAHEADTSNVHGITDTTVLATDAEVASAVSTHEADTTNVHGITDTSTIAHKNAANTFTTGPQRVQGTGHSGRVDLQTTATTAQITASDLGTNDFASLSDTGLSVENAAGDQLVASHALGYFAQLAAAADTLLQGKQTGDSNPRLKLTAAGAVSAGDGTVAPTTATFRSTNSIQTADALLDAIAALSMIDNRIIVGTGTDTVELWTVSDYIKTLLDDADAGAARATLEVPDEFAGVQAGTGRWYGPPCIGANVAPGANDIIRAQPLWFGKAVTVDRLACEVQASAGVDAGATLRLGLYADDGTGYPGALLVDGGTVAADSNGEKEVTISQAASGLIWAVAHLRGAPTTRPTLRTNSGSLHPGGQTTRTGSLAAAGPGTGWSTTSASATLPNPFPAGATASSASIRVGVRIA